MIWTYAGVRIFVQDISDGEKSILAKLQPLAGGTVLQAFGWETNSVKVTAIVVGDEDRDHLKSLTTSGGDSYELMSPEGDMGDYIPETVSSKRERVVYQTIREDLACDAPVYTVELDLIEDV